MNESEIEGHLEDAGYKVEVIHKPHRAVGPYEAVATKGGDGVTAWGDTRLNALISLSAAVSA